jgi:hypothetical protein
VIGGADRNIDSLAREQRIPDDRASVPAVADHLQGHALRDRARCPGVRQKREVGVTVDVDEPWGDHEAGSRNDPGRLSASKRFHGGDPIADDPNVHDSAGSAAAIDDRAARDQDVKHDHTLPGSGTWEVLAMKHHRRDVPCVLHLLQQRAVFHELHGAAK